MALNIYIKEDGTDELRFKNSVSVVDKDGKRFTLANPSQTTMKRFGYFKKILKLPNYDPVYQMLINHKYKKVGDEMHYIADVIDKSANDVKFIAKEKVKIQAGSRILNLSKEYEQRNMLAKSVELVNKKLDLLIGKLSETDPLSAEDIATLNTIKTKWDEIVDVRNRSKSTSDSIDLANTTTAIKLLQENF